MKKVLFLLLFLLNLQVIADYIGVPLDDNALHAQNYNNEGYYDCYDDGEWYISSFPCEIEACVTTCPFCHESYPCKETHYCYNFIYPDIPWYTIPGEDDDDSGNDDDNYDYIGGCGSADSSNQEEDYIDKVFSKIKNSVFKNISREKYIKDLKERIKDSKSVKQGNNGTCGAAVICKRMIETNPVMFIDIAAEIYEHGYYRIGSEKIGIPEKFFNESEEDLNTKAKATAVDALVQGAIVNYENVILDFNPFSGDCNFSSAMPPPYVNDFLVNIMGESVSHVGVYDQWVSANGLSTISYSDIDNYLSQGYFVIGYVATNVNDDNFTGNFTDHWVHITDESQNGNGWVLNYWSDGGYHNSQTSDNSNSGVYGLLLIENY